MATGITLTSAMRANLYSLQQTAQLMATTQQRLATGKKVNSALDNPNSYFSSQALTNRASDLSNLLDGMGQAIQAITQASNGITSAQSVVSQMKATATSALQSITASNASTAATLNTISNSAASMNALVTSLTTNASPPVSSGNAVGNSFTIKGSGGVAAAGVTVTINQGMTMADLNTALKNATGGDVSISVDNTGKFSIKNASSTQTYGFTAVTGTPLANIFGAVSGAALVANATTALGTGATISADNSLNANSVVAANASTKLYNTSAFATIAANTTNLVDSNGNTEGLTAGDALVVTLGTGASATTHTITVDSALGANGGVATLGDLVNQLNAISGIQASLDSTGKFNITASNGQALTLTDASGHFASLGFDATVAGTTTISPTNAAPNASYASQFDTLRSQLDQLVQDSSYQGINLISGSNNSPLKVVFDEKATGAASLTITAVDLTSSGLGVQGASGAWNSASDVQNTLTAITNASNTLRTEAQDFGTNLTTVQTRQDFTNNLINTLKTGSDNLTLADMNEESANMLALQTRSQLGTQALSLANQANQSVMRLFG